MDFIQKLYGKLSPRMKFTFVIGCIIGVFIHFYLLANGFVNKDGVLNYYRNQDLSASGRFTLTYLAGISSYFNLHYLNIMLSIIYLAAISVILNELFNLKSKISMALVPFILIGFPTVAGTMLYDFTADGYFLATLLSTIAVYVIYKCNNKKIAVVIAIVFIYVSLATYQANLAFVITLLFILFMKDNLIASQIQWKFYWQNAIAVFFGLLAYVIHFKIYDKINGLTSYRGISESGQINMQTIVEASNNSFEEFIKFLFNSFASFNLFEILNVLFVIIVLFALLIHVLTGKMARKNIIFILVTIIVLPFVMHIIFYISPSVKYHILMKHNFALLFIFGVFLLDYLNSKKAILSQALTLSLLIVISLISFNFVVISNIYYEKTEAVNKQTFALVSQIVYDIRHLDGYNEDLKIVTVGKFRNQISVSEKFDLKTPRNVGANSNLVFDFPTFYNYTVNEVGLLNKNKQSPTIFIDENMDEISTMEPWPHPSSIKIIEDTIVVLLSEVK